MVLTIAHGNCWSWSENASIEGGLFINGTRNLAVGIRTLQNADKGLLAVLEMTRKVRLPSGLFVSAATQKPLQDEVLVFWCYRHRKLSILPTE